MTYPAGGWSGRPDRGTSLEVGGADDLSGRRVVGAPRPEVAGVGGADDLSGGRGADTVVDVATPPYTQRCVYALNRPFRKRGRASRLQSG